jgi:hypothetical protein
MCGFSKESDSTEVFKNEKMISKERLHFISNFHRPEEINKDQSLPHTTNYTCSNKECITHKDKSKKDAVYMLYNDTYVICYVCCACDTVWKN